MSPARALRSVSAVRAVALAAIAVLVLLLSSLTPLQASAAGVSEVEPNNATAKAQSVALGTTVNASFLRAGDCDNGFYDCDVYRFSTSQAGRLQLDLRFSDALGTDGSFDLTVLDATGATLFTHEVEASDYSGATLRNLAMYVGTGTFYVSLKARVSGFSNGYIWSGQSYTLNARVTPTFAETERNGTTATADVLPLGKKILGASVSGDCNNNFSDCDYYRVQLDRATKLSLDFRFACNLGTDRLYTATVIDNAGKTLVTKQLTGGDCQGETMRAAVVTAPAGNAYVLIQSRVRTETRGKPYSVTLQGLLTTGTPSITGTVKVGSTLSAKSGTWGPSPVKLTYQWTRNGTSISGATGASYKLTAADAGKQIAVKVTGTKTGFRSATKASSTVSVPLLKLTQTPVPTITGTAKVGATLTAKPGTWSPGGVTLKYQWLRDGKAIVGAVKPTYKLTAADAGKKITVKVTGSKAGYASIAKTSAARTPAKR